MKKTLFVCLSILLSSSVLMAQGSANLKCSNETLRGPYMIASCGWGPDLQDPKKTVYFTSVGREVYDGQGKGTGTLTANLGGLVSTAKISETYTVNPDCSVSFKFELLVDGLNIKMGPYFSTGYITFDGQEGIAMGVSDDPAVPAAATQSTFKRLGPAWMK